jgi:hypothetical protein
MMSQLGWTKNADGTVNTMKTMFFASCGGALGGAACSPFYLVGNPLLDRMRMCSYGGSN